MVAFRSKKLTREDIGARLREARAHCGFSLKRAAERAGISPKTAVALEAGSFEGIRGTIYLRGFIKRYADAVGARAKPLLAALPAREERTLVAPMRAPRAWCTPSFLRWALAGVFVLAVAGYVGGEWKHLISAPALELFSPADGMVVTEASIEVQGASEPTARIAVNDETVSGRNDGAFSATVNLREGANTIVVTASRKHGRARTETRQVMYVPQIGSRRSEIGSRILKSEGLN